MLSFYFYYLFSREYLLIANNIPAAAIPDTQINSFLCVNLLKLAIFALIINYNLLSKLIFK